MTLAEEDNADGLPTSRGGYVLATTAACGWTEHARVCRRRRREVPALPPSPSPVARPLASSIHALATMGKLCGWTPGTTKEGTPPGDPARTGSPVGFDQAHGDAH